MNDVEPWNKRGGFTSEYSGLIMAASDELKFREFNEAMDLLAGNADATTPSISESQSHITLNMSSSCNEEYEPDEEDDKTELLSLQKKQSSFWTFEYYQAFFNVDTYQVLESIGPYFEGKHKNQILKAVLRCAKITSTLLKKF
ncbi:putative Protein YIPF protein [Naja naja]|nr:putative Protein YIPF protein [Naja naja]